MKKILTLFIALILVAGIVSMAKSADIDTSVTTEYATQYSKDRHIVQSSDGTIVVLYQRGTTGGLVAKKSTKASGGGAWYNLAGTVQTYTTIDSDTNINQFSICIDGNDNIYVAYLKSNDVFFKKLMASPGTWTTWTVGAQKTVDSAEDYAYPTITYQESNGRVWVAYGQDNGSSASLRAKYSTSPFDTWTLTTVDTGGTTDTSYCPALVIRNGNPYIVYGDGVELDMDYATWGGSSWTDGDIYTSGAASPRTEFSVTLIASTVHVAFFRYGTLRHSRSSTGAPPWTTIEISSSGDEDDYSCSLTTDWDTSDTELWCYASIYFADGEGLDWDLKYKKWTGSSWPNWSSVANASGVKEHYPNTPFVSGARIPVAWTKDDWSSPYDVEFNYSITLDETAPGAPTSVTATPSGWTSTNSFQVNWTNPSDPSGIAGAYYKLDSVPTSNTNGTWKTDKPITGITVSGSGSHPIYIWVRDRAGNINYVNRGNTTLYLDITAPTTPGTPSTPTPTSDTTPTWDWTASGDTHSGLRPTNTYIIYWDTVAGGTANSAYTNTNSYTHTVELGYGTWYAKVRAYDAVDNPSNFSGNGSVLIESPSQTYTWDEGGAYGDWDDPLNWDLDDGYPNAASDKAIINLGSESINTGAVLTIGQLELGSSYSGTLTLGGALTLDDSGPWDANLTISNANAVLSLAGYSLTLETGSTFSNNGTLRLQGDETVSKAPTNGSGSTVEYTATSSSRAIKNWTYHHLKINGSGGTFTVGAGETLGGNLTIAAGIFNLNGQIVNVTGNFLKSGGTLYMHSANDELDIAGNFTVEGGAADITVTGADIYIGGDIDISGDNSFDPSSGSYHMDHAGNATVSITGANNDLGYGSTDAYFYVNKTNSTDTVTLLTDMDSHFFLHQEGIFDVNGHNASFDGVYYGYDGSKLKMSSGTFRCGKNGFSGGTHSPWWVQFGWTEDISGGTITVYGGKHGTEGTAYFTNDSNFTPTGGTFELVGTDAASIYIAEVDDAHFNFYNLSIGDGTNAKTVEMHASSQPLDVDGNFTVKTNATFDTSGKAIDVASSVDIIGTFTANNSTITCSYNWNSSSGTFNWGTSTVDLTGTGNLTTAYSYLYNLKCAAAPDKITTLQSTILLLGTLTLGSGGTLTGPSYSIVMVKDSGTPLINGGATVTLNAIDYNVNNGTITVAGGTYGVNYLTLNAGSSNVTYNLGGDMTITGTGDFSLFAVNGATNVVCNTQNYDLTADRLWIGNSSAYGSTKLNLGTSTIDIGTGGLDMDNNGGSHTLNLSSATVTCAGNWELVDGTGNITQNPGTSTVTLDDSIGIQTVTSNNQSFYHLVIDNTGTEVQLQDAADIDGGLNVATGTLDLNSFDITISSDVSISGSGLLTCSSGEQITVGRNWSAASGATFTAASSTTTFNGSGSFNILSSGTTFYNLAFSNSVSTWTLTDALYSAGDFTITNSSGNVDSNNKDLTIAGDFRVNGGNFKAGVSTITVAGDWDTSVSANAFTYDTSTVDLTGTGTVNIYGPNWWNSFEFYNLKCATAGETTTLDHHVGVKNTLTLGDATGTLSGAGYVMTVDAPGTPFVHGGAEITLAGFVYYSKSGTTTVAGGDYGQGYLMLYPEAVGNTYNFGGDITVGGKLYMNAMPVYTGQVVNTQGYNLTAKELEFGNSSLTGDFTVNCGTSTIDIGADGVDMGTDGGSHTLNLSSATVTCAGDWQLVDGSGSIDQNWGTSTVTFDGLSTSTSTLTGSTTFYVLISTTTGKNVEVSSDTVIGVTNHLNFENITLHSTSGGATWYLNLDPSATQDVFNVNVKDSNASGGQTIIAPASTDLGNNTNWVFDDSILTWDGSESTDWDTAENWNFNIVPLSTHTVIIPDGTPYDPQLTSNVIISSITIETDGQLSLNERDISVSNDVYISGSLLCSNTEQITIGGNWSVYSGAIFTAASSTTTFNGSGSFNILSSGTTFYNLAFSNSISTWTLTDALYSAGDFTITNSSGNVDSNDKNLTIAGDFTINGGKFTAGASAITVGGDWDSSVSADAFDGDTSSTVDLTGTGTVNVYGPNWWESFEFYNLKCAAGGETTTLDHHVGVKNTLTLGSGTLSGAGYRMAVDAPGTPFVHGGAAITLDYFVYYSQSGTITVAGGDYGTCTLLFRPTDSNITYNFGGPITVNGTFQLTSKTGETNVVYNTQNYDLTANRIWLGVSYATGSFTVNCGTSTIDIGTGGVDMGTDGGSHTLNLSSATVTCAGDWQLVDGSGSIDQNWGTSTVTFDGLSTSTSTLTGSTTFYVLISTTTNKTVQVSSDIVIGVTNHLNFENITLHSTLDNATWYLNLSGTQDVSNVDVRDSNASGGDTIIDFDCPDIESCYYGNNTNWDFGPPAAITDLTGLCNSDTGYVTLYWSTPGDDEWTGTLVNVPNESKYIIDYSTYSIAWSTSTYEVEIPTHSVAPHTEVSHTITGLTADTTWYFRIWTADEIPRWSGLSNGATVWVNPILSVSISTDTYNFGTIDCGTSTVSGNIITVTNDSNVTETYSVKCSSTTKWTPEDTPGQNEFTLQSAFHSSEPADSDLVWETDDILTESLQTCTTAVFSIDGTEHGKEVPPFNANTRKLWYRLKTPLSTSTTDQQNIIITISAEQSP